MLCAVGGGCWPCATHLSAIASKQATADAEADADADADADESLRKELLKIKGIGQ